MKIIIGFFSTASPHPRDDVVWKKPLMSEIIFANHWISSSLTTLLDKPYNVRLALVTALHWGGGGWPSG